MGKLQQYYQETLEVKIWTVNCTVTVNYHDITPQVLRSQESQHMLANDEGNSYKPEFLNTFATPCQVLYQLVYVSIQSLSHRTL